MNINPDKIIPEKAIQIMSFLRDGYQTEALIVGGFVRDTLLGVSSKDVDIEVYGLHIDMIKTILERRGFKVDAVGKAFGVLKIDNELDISVPRRENKVGVGHRGFNMVPDPNMSVKEAASRRDFTMNAMAMDIYGTIIDPFGGRNHLSRGILSATSQAFAEDPLRVMRAMQFASRFNMTMNDRTTEMCREMSSQRFELPKERIWEEWKKWATKGKFPSLGLKIMKETGWLDPEISAMVDVPQSKEWHPEGCVFTHTCHVVDAAVVIAEREQLGEHDRLVLLFSALAHDFGKATTTKFEDGMWRAKGHCQASVEPTRSFLERIGAPLAVIAEVEKLVAEHLVHSGSGTPTDRAVRRLADRIAPSNIRALGRVIEADHSGRPPLPPGNPFSPWVARADALSVSDGKPKPILLGRHLIELGMKPGKAMGDLLKDVFQMQLDGQIQNLETALQWASHKLKE